MTVTLTGPVMTTVMPETDTRDDTLTRPVPREAEPGDHEKFSHYVPKDKIMESAMTGEPVRALCGKLWIPNRDPEKFPVCPSCQEIYAALSG